VASAQMWADIRNLVLVALTAETLGSSETQFHHVK
jgi:hypothetical protein